MATAEVSQSDVTILTTSLSGAVELAQSDTIVVYNLPSDQMDSSQGDVMYVSLTSSDAQVTQADVTVVMRGRVDDPSVRAWTFTLDGHDFYVLRLGNSETLVYDLTSETWYKWASGTGSLWNVYNGENWVPGNKYAEQFGSNIIVGSDSNGALFFLDPQKAGDDAAAAGREESPFRRRVTAQVSARGYDQIRMYEVQLIGSTGELLDPTLTDISLLYSDDRGDNYTNAGTVSIPENDFEARATWRSMGSFRSPGRLIRVEDNGSLQRIDSLTMNIGSPPNGA